MNSCNEKISCVIQRLLFISLGFLVSCGGGGGGGGSPTAALTASPSSIANGATSTLSWSSTNSISCTSSGGGGTGTVGSFTTSSLTTTTYTVTCTGAGGTASQSATVTVAAPIPTLPYGSGLDLSNVSDVLRKIWGPGSNGIELGGGLNYSTQVGVGWSQQYSGIFVTSYSIQGSATQIYLTQIAPVSVELRGPAGAIIEIWDLEILSVIATNYANPGSVVTFTAQPNHRYGGFAWYADNSQKDMEIYAFITPTSVSQGGLTWLPPSSAGYSWPMAITYCANTTIGGLTGWRLPTQAEALALWNSGAMNGHGWEHSLYSQYWTSITSATFSGEHYGFFLFGYVGSNTESYPDTSTLGVVCVR